MSAGFLFGAGYPWPSLATPLTAEPSSVVANDELGLALAPLRAGRLGLDSPDGSLGGLTLPRGVAVSGSTVFVLSTQGDRVFRYDPVRQTLVPLPEVGQEGVASAPDAGEDSEPRRFRIATNIAAFGAWLYVADPSAHRVQVFDVESLALVRVHDNLAGPVDVAAGPDGVYILDRPTGRVLRDHPSLATLEVVVNAPYRSGRWDRLAVDRERRVYLRDVVARPSLLDVFDPPRPGRGPRSVRMAGSAEVRDRFTTPEVTEGANRELTLTAALLDPGGLRRDPRPEETSWALGKLRYVIDRKMRVLRVHLTDGRRRHQFGPFDASGQIVLADSPDVWRPVDGVGISDQFFLLDERYQTVLAHGAGTDTIRTRFTAPADHPRRWRRIATDGEGCLLLWDGGDVVDRVDQAGQLLGEEPAARVRDAFRLETATAARPAAPVLTRDGVGKPKPSRRTDLTFRRQGVWVSEWIDSGIYNCQWDRVVLSIAALPPGATVTVSMRSNTRAPQATAPVEWSDAAGVRESWQTAPRIVADPQPEPGTQLEPVDLLVQSPPGQYLQIMIEMTSDGDRAPVIGSIRISAPRESWLQYLPATFSQPEDQREFLERYLAIAQSTWTGVEASLASFDRFLDPLSVPKEQLAYLASWLDLRLEGSFEPDQNRQVLDALPRLWRDWGTVAGIRAWLQVYLAAISGVAIEDITAAGVPGIVEEFVERRRLLLNRPDTSELCAAEALWSPSVERRFQVGVFDELGQAEIVSVGQPEVDVFRHYAHRFRVYVPAAWVRNAETVALLRRAIDLQRPAHTTFELVLVEPRFRIGDQSTIALDTVIGGSAPWRLGCPDDAAGSSRAPHRVGFDAVVGGTQQTANGAGTVLA